MKHDFSHIRPKDGEALADYFTRVVEGWAVAQGKGRVGRIQYVLQRLERAAHDDGRADAAREAEDRHSKETAALHRRIAELQSFLKVSVPAIDAEAERQKAAEGMRNKAAERVMEDGCIPNCLSEAIYALSLPKPLWTETVRPK